MEMYENLARILKSGERVALATVLKALGSTPRSAGTRMVIRREGNHLGTVGGGTSEAKVIEAGLKAIEEGNPFILRANLTEEVSYDAEAACGGIMDFLVVPWGRDLLPVMEALIQGANDRQEIRLLTCLAPSHVRGAMLVMHKESLAFAGLDATDAHALIGALKSTPEALTHSEPTGKVCPASSHGGMTTSRAFHMTAKVKGEDWSLLHEEMNLAPVLLICGGGHIALPLTAMARLIGFNVVVIDDRQEFANTGRFPQASRVICAPFVEALRDYPLDRETYAVVVTRGHQQDLSCLQQLLGRDLGYLGMIGSRRRVKGVLDLLRQDGWEPGTLAQLHSPIGLDIGAETPAEIALSILAEIVQARRGGSGKHLRLTP